MAANKSKITQKCLRAINLISTEQFQHTAKFPPLYRKRTTPECSSFRLAQNSISAATSARDDVESSVARAATSGAERELPSTQPTATLNCTINKYFITVKYFCLLLLNRWDSCAAIARFCILLFARFPPHVRRRRALRWCAWRSCLLFRAHARVGMATPRQHRLIGQLRVFLASLFFCSSSSSSTEIFTHRNL
jgi:hypothetical protein